MLVLTMPKVTGKEGRQEVSAAVRLRLQNPQGTAADLLRLRVTRNVM